MGSALVVDALPGRGVGVSRDGLAAQMLLLICAVGGLVFVYAAGYLAGAELVGGDWAWGGRVLAILAILFVTLPAGSHMLARAAAKEQFGRKEIARARFYPRP